MRCIRSTCRLLAAAATAALGLFSIPAAGESSAAIEIAVRDRQGEAIPGAYVALVPVEEPWSRPLAEGILEESGEVRWPAPPGSYRVVAGAPGYFWEMSGALELAAEGLRREVLALRPLAMVAGRVVDREGTPVEGARVGDFRVFLRELSLRLSPLGEGHLRANWETVTGGDGRFELPFLKGHRASVWIEAPGFTPGLIDNALFKGGIADEIEVVLAPGSSLIAKWATGKKLAGFLQLKSKDRSLLDKLPLVVPDWIWERPFGGEGEARWESLPPGAYDLFWVGDAKAGSTSDSPAERLASLTLEAGAKVVHEIELSDAMLADGARISEASSEAGGPLTLELRGARSAKEEAVVVRRLGAKGWQPLEASARRGSGGFFVRLPHGCLPGVRLVVELPEAFGVTLPLERERCTAAESVDLWPRAQVRGQIKAPAGEALPKHAALNVGPCPGDGEIHRGALEMPIQIEADGRWQSLFPAGCGCFSLLAGDYAALAWHKQRVKAAGTLEAGLRTLAHGGRLLVRVVDAGGQALPGVRLDAQSPKEAEILAAGAPREEQGGILRSAVTDAKGWASLRGLPPGQWVLRGSTAASRVATFGEPIEVAAREERIVDPWIFAGSGSLEIVLESAAGSFEEMEVVLREEGAEPPQRVASEVETQGRVFFEELKAGRWRLQVMRRVDGQPQEVARLSVTVEPGRHHVATIAILTARYRARLMDGDRALEGAGRIELLPLDADPQAAPVLATIDDEGRFEVHLAAPRAFRARLVLPERKLRAQIDRVEFVDAEEVLEIALPAGTIGGVVLDAAKQPVDGAAVRAEQHVEGGPPQEHRTQSDRLGRFELPMLAAGTWQVVAESAKGRSRAEEVALAADERRLGLTLVLEAVRELRGRVIDETSAPVAGARVLLASPNVGGQLEGTERRSQPDGSFSFRLDGSTTRATVLVQKTGGPVDLRFVSLSDAELSIQVGSAVARLRLPPAAKLEEWFVQAADGAWLHWNVVAGEEAGDRRILRMKPGAWTVKNLVSSLTRVFQLGPGDDQLVVVE